MKTKDLFQRLPDNARILLIRLRSMGDCLLLTSPVRALKEHFPGFRISVAVESRFAGCFDGNPDFDERIVLRGKLSAATLLARRFDAIVNLHGGPTSLIYALLARGPRIGSESFQFGGLYSARVPVSPRAHSTESTMNVFRFLGLTHSGNAPPLRFEVHSAESEKMRDAAGTRDYVVIQPGALMATKRWDAGRFASVARFIETSGSMIIVTGGPEDEATVAEVVRLAPRAKAVLGLTIPELAELIRNARLYIGNDSGPMHLASAVGTPIVAVWGSSDLKVWSPWSVPYRAVQNFFECNPCPGYRCLVAQTPLCIESVTTEQVIGAVKELLT